MNRLHHEGKLVGLLDAAAQDQGWNRFDSGADGDKVTPASPYPSPENREGVEIQLRKRDTTMQKYHMYVGGEWVAPSSGEWFKSYNPFTGEPWAMIARGNTADADHA